MLLANPRKESYRRPVMMQPMHCTPAKMGAGARIDWQSGLLWLRTIFLGSPVLRGGAERPGCAGSGLHDLRGPREELGGRRESRRTGLPVPMKQAFSLPGPTAFAYLTAAGSQIPGVCARERESLARTCSSGALAGDLDHPEEAWSSRSFRIWAQRPSPAFLPRTHSTRSRCQQLAGTPTACSFSRAVPPHLPSSPGDLQDPK
ncbi:uncharacterized protein LOC115527442 [Lynx canadensis]|uniref:uncharacterized protein LOC115527442 n=1 Tax=Lynx canadensis TaxID=61383 RepID=UPI0011B02C79|nr:uncharacterized protein LOC115527442 [Lynx canadensis]